MDELTDALRRCGKSKKWLADYLGVQAPTVSGWAPDSDKYRLALLYAKTELKMQAYDQIAKAIEVLK